MYVYVYTIMYVCVRMCMSILLTIGAHVQRVLQYLVCMYVCVFALICRLTHWNHKREIPTDSSQYGNDKKGDFGKTLRSKVMA